MALTDKDIKPGIVADMDCGKLKAAIQNKKITEIQNIGDAEDLPDGSRPFLCVGVQNGQCQWAELTTQPKIHRLLLQKDWRRWQKPLHGFEMLSSRWYKDDQYPHGVVLEGKNADFVKYSNEFASAGGFRIVTAAGVKAAKKHLSGNLASGHSLLP